MGPRAGVAYSEGEILVSPALITLLGRLPWRRGEFAPVETDTGLLSPTKLWIRVSISRRLSALPGVGLTIWRKGDQL